MTLKTLLKQIRGFAKPFRVTDGEGFRLKDFDPGDTLDLDSEDKPRVKEALERHTSLEPLTVEEE